MTTPVCQPSTLPARTFNHYGPTGRGTAYLAIDTATMLAVNDDLIITARAALGMSGTVPVQSFDEASLTDFINGVEDVMVEADWTLAECERGYILCLRERTGWLLWLLEEFCPAYAH